jgi:3-phosphoshikimate 1-carboxyvinyltransferase
MNFSYKGKLSASKSIMNRGLICSSFKEGFTLIGDSKCDDVIKMQTAVQGIGNESTFDCGAAGTVLRFLAFRISRLKGEFILKGSERLFSRPQQELVRLLEEMGSSVEINKDHMKIVSSGWNKKDAPIRIDRSKSSQFITGLVLSAWDLPFPLEICWEGQVVSDSYFHMTLQMLQDLGMEMVMDGSSIKIPANQKIKVDEYRAEIDLSSAFAIAAIALVAGRAELEDFPSEPIQPDGVFVDILLRMNAPVNRVGSLVTVEQANRLKGVDWSLANCPDLFPVLAMLCSLAHGRSHLYGAPHLVHKESNRINKTAELLDMVGSQYELKADGVVIHGTGGTIRDDNFRFETDEDHRLAFAAEVLRKAGLNIEIVGKEVVTKSFPDFWEITEKGK